MIKHIGISIYYGFIIAAFMTHIIFHYLKHDMRVTEYISVLTFIIIIISSLLYCTTANLQ